MRMGHDIRLVCFDWGGVLLKICRSWEEGCEAAGVSVCNKRAAKKCMNKLDELSKRFHTGQMSDKAFFRSIAKASDDLYEPEQVRAIHDAWLLEEFPGVHELVEELNALPTVATALLSNTNALHWARKEEEFTVAASLEHQHASHLFGLAKPDEKIFAAFERRVGAAGEQILFFEDTETNVDAAREFGWNAELIDPLGNPAEQMREHLSAYGVL